MNKLLPCPFCGGKASIVLTPSGLMMILCDKCGATVSFQGKEKRPATGWNRRGDMRKDETK